MGVPVFRLDVRLSRWHKIWSLPPRWWYARSCRRGVCAYENSWCPNGCLEHVELDSDECRCNEQARELGGETLRRAEAEQGRLDDAERARRARA